MTYLLLLVATLGGLQSPALNSECVKFASNGRLREGQSFVKALPGGLEFRLRPGPDGWDINVVDPASPKDDFVALVSPPYKFAPHLYIPSREQPVKLNLFDRELYFVLNARDYQRMMKVHQDNWYDWEPIIRMREAITKGVLYLHFTGFGARKVAGRGGNREALAWITFTGEACVPR